MTQIRTAKYAARKRAASCARARVLHLTERDAVTMATANLRNAIRALDTPATPGLVPSPLVVALAEIRNALRHLTLAE